MDLTVEKEGGEGREGGAGGGEKEEWCKSGWSSGYRIVISLVKEIFKNSANGSLPSARAEEHSKLHGIDNSVKGHAYEFFKIHRLSINPHKILVKCGPGTWLRSLG